MFRDRQDAGARLAEALAPLFEGDAALPAPVVLALPRGGVPVAAEVARRLAAPLDLVLVRKIGAPLQPELALGAVVDGDAPVLVLNDDVLGHVGLDETELRAAERRALAEIEARRPRYLGDRAPVPVAGRTAVVVDDGVATGASMRAALRALRRRGAATLLAAVPVAAPDSLRSLEAEADRVVCLEAPALFRAVGAHYRDFRQTGDDEVIALLAAAAG